MKKEKDLAVRQSKNEQIEVYLQEKYEFRFNVIKSKPEYRIKDRNIQFLPITKFALNSFKRWIDTELGLSTSAENIRTILESDFSPKIHPVKEYFKYLPRLDPEANRHIHQLAQTVTTANPEKWHEYLTKWLIDRKSVV